MSAVERSAAFHGERAQGIGGSDVAAIVGLDRRRDAYAVWCEKVGLIDPSLDEGSEATDLGHVLEAPVADEWARRTGLTLCRTSMVVDEDHPHRRGRPDRLVAPHPDEMPNAVLEVKTTTNGDEWNEDDAPARVTVQAWHYCLITGYEVGYIAALIGDRGGMRIGSYETRPDRRTLDALADLEDRWWTEHVIGGVPPAPTASSRRVLERSAGPVGAERIDLDEHAEQALRDYKAALADVKAAEARRDAAAASVMAALHGAGAGYVNGWRVTWRPANEVDEERLAAERPELFAEFSTPKLNVGAFRKAHKALAREYERPGSRRFNVTAPPDWRTR